MVHQAYDFSCYYRLKKHLNCLNNNRVPCRAKSIIVWLCPRGSPHPIYIYICRRTYVFNVTIGRLIHNPWHSTAIIQKYAKRKACKQGHNKFHNIIEKGRKEGDRGWTKFKVCIREIMWLFCAIKIFLK